MNGIDISNYQAGIDISKFTGDIVYIKATEGLTYNNPAMKTQYAAAKAHGKKVGFYHFLQGNDPIAEAKHFLSVVAGLGVDCKFAIDAEVKFSGVSSHIRQFADYLISQGKEVVLYTYTNFYHTYLDSTVKNLPLWIAQYSDARPLISSMGWQYSSKGNVGGVTVDLDTFDAGILINKPVVTANTSEIKQLQTDLNSLFNAGLVVDGVEGKLTSGAVVTAKKILGCTNLVSAITEIKSHPTLQVGSTGYAVRWLQNDLSGLDVDGQFGSKTKIKVQNFQASHGLVPDGVVGTLTWSKLFQ